jgi:hypothetical protein
MCDAFVAISVRAPKLLQCGDDSASDELGKAKIFIIEMVLNVMMGPDGWRNGRPWQDAAQRDALRRPAFRQAITSFMFFPNHH